MGLPMPRMYSTCALFSCRVRSPHQRKWPLQPYHRPVVLSSLRVQQKHPKCSTSCQSGSPFYAGSITVHSQCTQLQLPEAPAKAAFIQVQGMAPLS